MQCDLCGHKDHMPQQTITVKPKFDLLRTDVVAEVAEVVRCDMFIVWQTLSSGLDLYRVSSLVFTQA